MLIKSQSDEIQSFLGDASNMQGGAASRVLFPESTEEVAVALAEAARERTPVTVAGAGTGIVGGRVPFGGVVLATDRLNRIKEIVRFESGGRATAQSGVVLADFQRAVEAQGLLYPPDPTERSCYLGGSVATNASGSRTFKYGPTRRYISRLKIALATADVLDLRRGEIMADAGGTLRVPLPRGRSIEARLPSYRMPQTRKHASGYYVAPGMDALDLFIGSEGTLGVITLVEAELLPRPAGVLAGIVFFREEDQLLAFVREVRTLSLRTRAEQERTGKTAEEIFTLKSNTDAERPDPIHIDARAIEYFDAESLHFLRAHYERVPREAAGAIFFEQEIALATEENYVAAWLALLQKQDALLDESWFAVDEKDQARLREFRHHLPVLVNEWIARHNQRKVSTDMAVPDEEFAGMLRFYQETLRASQLRYVIFGHIGDNHVHVNILPRDDEEAAKARRIYLQFVERAVRVGGTVSAEHGIGKLKRDYLRVLYGDRHLREMAALKKAFDPACILGRGNIFAEEYL
jgi:D-lactate dehydrogenase (cytochrome)